MRDWRRWAASVRRHIGERPLQNLERLQYHLLSPLRYKTIQEYSDEDLRHAYFQHLDNVLSFFSEGRGQLRIFSLHDPQLGNGILVFLKEGAEFPTRDYIRDKPPVKKTAKPVTAKAVEAASAAG